MLSLRRRWKRMLANALQATDPSACSSRRQRASNLTAPALARPVASPLCPAPSGQDCNGPFLTVWYHQPRPLVRPAWDLISSQILWFSPPWTLLKAPDRKRAKLPAWHSLTSTKVVAFCRQAWRGGGMLLVVFNNQQL